jgi:UDP-N-acetylmuramoyl-tripeptide--D-alanyl-D-alanine ligase
LSIKKYGSSVLIDDTYNANPESMNHSIELLSLMNKKKNKVAVLGDMFELGNEGISLHKEIADAILQNEINEVYTTGKLMKHLDQKLTGKKIIHKYFSDRKKLSAFLKKKDIPESVILVKGSRGMKMEEFVKVIEERLSN